MAGTSVERRLGDHEPILRRAIATKRKFAREFVTPSLQRRKRWYMPRRLMLMMRRWTCRSTC